MVKRFQKMRIDQFKRRAPECDIQKGITDLLTLVGIPFSVTDSGLAVDGDGRAVGRPVSQEGWPDITAVIPPHGRLLGIEVKTRRGRVRDSQKYMLLFLEQAGALVCVPRSIEEFARVLIDAGIEHQALRELA